MCRTRECVESTAPTSSGLPSKATIGVFESLPNELIALILNSFTLKELSHFSTFNKWFRDFIVQHFLESRKGLESLLGQHFSASNPNTKEQKMERLQLFSELGLKLKSN